MKRIVKTSEPTSFTGWKTGTHSDWVPSWEALDNPIKGELHQRLLDDQGAICCYCGGEITDGSSHIEHLVPRRGPSARPDLELEFKNLLASCGLNAKPREPRHCGPAKDSWYDANLLVSPLTPACESKFRYLDNGAVEPSEPADQRAVETILRLKLDIHKLREARRGAIEGYLGDPNTLSGDELLMLNNAVAARRDDGKFEPYCFAITQAIQRLLP